MPLVSADHVFARLVAASEHWAGAERGFIPELFVEHAQLLTDIHRFLPSAADGSIAGWSARRDVAAAGPAQFGFVVDDYHVHDDLVWRRVREFVRGLYGITGLPGEEAKMTLFLGNYARTPFGLHRGRSANFMFVVDGLKRIRAWPDAFFRGKPDMTNRLDYERYNDDSVVLDAGRARSSSGPPRTGTSARTPAAPRSRSAWRSSWSPSRAPTWRRRSSRRSLTADRAPPAAGGSGRTDHPGRLARPARAAADRDEGRRWQRALAADRLNRVTGAGLRPRPAAGPRAAALGDDESCAATPTLPVRWTRVGDEIVCSAGGHAFALPDRSPAARAAAAGWACADPLRVGDAHRPVLRQRHARGGRVHGLAP